MVMNMPDVNNKLRGQERIASKFLMCDEVKFEGCDNINSVPVNEFRKFTLVVTFKISKAPMWWNACD